MTGTDGLADQLTLTESELTTLHALRLQMMRTDIARERREVTRENKQRISNAIHTEFLVEMRSAGYKLRSSDLSEPGAPPRLAGGVQSRSRAMIVLIDLMTFSPWLPSMKWVASARSDSLQLAAEQLAGLSSDDLDVATKEFDALMRQLRRKSIKWGRVAMVSAVGLGVGVATAGAAAPAIGGLIGASLGLSGAAASSAGLAMLGGGTIAAGGFGMFGGTILVSGVGGVFGAGAAGATARFSRIGSAQIAADAIKLDLLAKLVLADAPDRDQKLRRVAEGLQSRINEYSEKISLLTERIVTLKAENKRLGDENRALRDELADLRAARAEAEKTKATLEVVRDRLPAVAR